MIYFSVGLGPQGLLLKEHGPAFTRSPHWFDGDMAPDPPDHGTGHMCSPLRTSHNVSNRAMGIAVTLTLVSSRRGCLRMARASPRAFRCLHNLTAPRRSGQLKCIVDVRQYLTQG